MVPDSIDHHNLSNGAKNTIRKLTGLLRRLGGECDWPERRIAAYVGIPRMTYRDHRRELEAAGELVIERRRRKGCRLNDTNIMRLGGGGLKIQPQKKSEVLNTSTKASTRQVPREVSKPTEAAKPTYTQLQWEHRRRTNHPPAMRERFEYVGARIVADIAARDENRRGWRELRERIGCAHNYRLTKAQERTRQAIEACVGMYEGPEMSEETLAQLRLKHGVIIGRKV